jgi:tetratricopeptide (TPR) repeat protein
VVDALFEKANNHLSQGQLQSAWDRFQQILELEPKNSQALFGSGYTLLLAENYKESKGYFEEVLEHEDIDNSIYMCLGVAHFYLDEHDQAQQYLKKSYELDGENNFSSYFLCTIGVKTQDLGLIKRHIAKTLAFDFFDPEKCNFIGMALHLLNLPEQSLDYYMRASKGTPQPMYVNYNIGVNLKALGRYEEAEKAYRIQLENDSPLEQNFKNLTSLLDGQGKYTESIPLYQAAIGHFGRKNYLLIGLGNGYTELGRFSEAKALFFEVLASDDNDEQACHSLGITLIREELTQESIAYFKKAIDIKPDFFGAYLSLAKVYTEVREFQLAEDLLFMALKLEGDKSLVHEDLGFLYLNQGNFKKSIAAFEKVLERKSDKFRAYSNLLLLYNKRLEIDKVIALSDRYLKDEPMEALTYVNCAATLFSVGFNVEKVFEVLEQGLENMPGNPDILVYQSKIYSIIGENDKALACLKEIIARYPDHLDANIAYASALMEIGKYHLAKGYIDKANFLDADSEDVKIVEAQYFFSVEEYTNSYKTLSRLAIQGTEIPKVYEILSKIPELLNPDRLKHFYRALLEYEGLIGLQSVFDFGYVQTLEAPMLIDKLFSRSLVDKGIFSHDSVIEDAKKQTRYFKRLFHMWNQYDVDKNKRLLIESIIYFYLGDPVHGYRCFSLEMDEEYLSNSSIALYYFELCAITTGIKVDFVLDYVIKLKENFRNDLTLKDRFYLALSYSLENDHNKSIEILETIAESYPPAKYQLCAEFKLSLLNDNNKHEEKLLKAIATLTMSEDINPVYRYGIEAIHPGVNPDTFLAEIAPVIHYLELTDTLGSIFAIRHEVESIAELIILDEMGQHSKPQTLIRNKISEIYKRLIEVKLDKAKFLDALQRYSAEKNIEEYLASELYTGMSLEYFFEEGRYEKELDFGFKFHLHLICELFNQGKLTFEQSINLLYYLHYGIKRIPFQKNGEVVSFFIDTVAELLIDSLAIPNMYILQKIVVLADILKDEKRLKKPPLKTYKEFIAKLTADDFI